MRDLTSLIAIQTIIDNITRIIRDKRVLLDLEVATLYQVDVTYLRKKIEIEKARLPKDFMFQLTVEEYRAISSKTKNKELPYALTESGIMMIGGLLKTKKAIKIHIQVIEHFVQLYKRTKQISELINLNAKEESSKEIFTIFEQMLKEK